MKITSKGQVTIPLEIRRKFGLHPHSEVRFRVRGDVAVIEKIADPGAGWAMVERMRGRANAGLSTDEIMRLTRGED